MLQPGTQSSPTPLHSAWSDVHSYLPWVWTGHDYAKLGSGETVTTKQQLAEDILTLAADGGMPDSYWSTDQRMLRACEVLKITPKEAQKRYG